MKVSLFNFPRQKFTKDFKIKSTSTLRQGLMDIKEKLQLSICEN